MTIEAYTCTPADGVPPAAAPFAHATATGNTLYVTGQMPIGLDGRLVEGRVEAQTEQVLHNLARVLVLAGGTLADVVHARAYLAGWDDYASYSEIWRRWFPDHLRSRTWVGVSELAAGAAVEVDFVAWRASGWA